MGSSVGRGDVRSGLADRGRPQARDRFDQLAAGWLAGLGSERTRDAYRGDLERFRSWLAVRGVMTPLDASAADVERFGAECAGAGEAGSTTARRVSALRSFFRYAVSAGEATTSPIIAWAQRANDRSSVGGLDAANVGALVGAAAQLGSRTAALVGLMLFSGMRLDEVLACDAGDVSQRRESTIIVVGRRSGARDVLVDRWTAAALRSYLAGRTDGPLLLGESPTRGAERLTRFGADYLIKRAGAAAGIDQSMSSNTLRRTFVARSHADGMALDDIRGRLGHRDVRTTRRHLPDAAGP